jgi:hypothetical protein
MSGHQSSQHFATVHTGARENRSLALRRYLIVTRSANCRRRPDNEATNNFLDPMTFPAESMTLYQPRLNAGGVNVGLLMYMSWMPLSRATAVTAKREGRSQPAASAMNVLP